MTAPTLIDNLRHLQHSLMTRYAEASNYAQSWGKDFVFKYIQEVPESYKGFKFDPNELTFEDMRKLGFRQWDKSGLQLIPLWLFPYIKSGSVIVSINGDTLKFSASEEDNDHRFGLLSFGVIVEPKAAELAEPVSSSDDYYDQAAESLGN